MNKDLEAVARAICECQGLDWAAQATMHSGSGNDTDQEAYRDEARAALNADPVRDAALELITQLLLVWDPEWEPGKSLHAEAEALLDRAASQTAERG